ncbi:hypothetical protein D3C72_210880 [compost metagenome]
MRRALIAMTLVLGITSCDLKNPLVPNAQQPMLNPTGEFYVFVELDGWDDSLVRNPYYLDGRGEEIDTSLFIKRDTEWIRIRLAFDRQSPEIYGAFRAMASSPAIQSGMPPLVIYHLPAKVATLDSVPVDLYVKVAQQYVKVTLEVEAHHDAASPQPSTKPSGTQDPGEVNGGIL